MQKVEHKVTHYYQPTNNSCGYAALSILLSNYGITVKPEELLSKVPQPNDEKGEPTGSVTTQLATWCVSIGKQVKFYSFDCEILDLEWSKLNKTELIDKLELVKDVRDVSGLGGKHWSKIYVNAYIQYLKSGGELLYILLKDGPVYVNVCANTFNNEGRATYPDHSKRELVLDDVNGKVSNHSVVIYGYDENGKLLVADPWRGLRIIDIETMLCSISTAQIECDNQCFVIE
jgi:Peptidase C39 family